MSALAFASLKARKLRSFRTLLGIIIGGVGGVMSASLAAMLAGQPVPELAAPTPGWAVSMGFLVPVIVGIFFGTRPAMRVANLAPVEALRYG